MLIHDLPVPQAVRAEVQLWRNVLQHSMTLWENENEALLFNTDREAADAATEWILAEHLLVFARIGMAARIAVENQIPHLSKRWIQRAFPEGTPKGLLPPPLSYTDDRRITWMEVRARMNEGTLSMDDAGLLLRCFGKPSLGTHESLLRRLEWIVPPEGCPWHPWVKEALWRIARRPICASSAKRKFRLVDRDLKRLVPRCVENPHYRSGPPMRLYELAEVARVAGQRQGIKPPRASETLQAA